MRARTALLASVALALSLSGCGGGGGGASSNPPIVVPPSTPPPTGTASYDVVPCFTQDTGLGLNVAQLVIPDVLTIDFRLPSGFPNGRGLPDPVADRILAAIFLDLRVHSVDTFVNLPLNPPANDRPFLAAFPYLAPPQGNPPIEAPGGVNFNFRTDPDSSYVQVDRTGFPALSTALVAGPQKNAFNDDSAADDLTANSQGLFKWVPEFRAALTLLTNALGDDLEALNLKLCATKI